MYVWFGLEPWWNWLAGVDAASPAASKVFWGRGSPLIHLGSEESGVVPLSFEVSHTLEQPSSLPLLLQANDSSQLSPGPLP